LVTDGPRDPLIGCSVGHYEVVGLIGAGGMGVVYEARDLELSRRVALKFLSEDFSADPSAVERFRREARAASALNHPHICTIHDIGTHEGRPFIVMERLEGQTLRQPRPLPPDRVIEIGIQIADALQAAHEAGFIHRDIKPANVFLTTRGDAKLLDFGLAKLVAARPGAGVAENDATQSMATMTRQGAIVGTLAYMSPEQLRGEPLDARTDLFSLGALLYELVTGRGPFTGPNQTFIIDGILHGDPVPPRRLNPQCPPGLDRIVARALEKEPALRYQSAAELRADLERSKRDGSADRTPGAPVVEDTRPTGTAAPVPARARRWRGPVMAVAAVAVMGIAGAGLAYRFLRHASPPLTDRDTVLIADIDNRTGDRTLDDTLKQALTVQLGQSPFLAMLSSERVAGTLSLMKRPPGQKLDRTVGREVCQRNNAKATITGSIDRLDTKYLVAVEAVNCATGDVLALVQGEARSREEAVLQTIGSLATALRARLGEALPSIQKYDVPLRQAMTSSFDALRFFSAGMASRERGDDATAVPLFERAVALDPNFALAWAHLNSALIATGRVLEAYAALQRAFEGRDRAPEQERYYITHRYYTSWKQIRKAIECNRTWAAVRPRDFLPHDNLCKQGWQLGEGEAALAECRAALRLDPTTLGPYQGLIEFNRALGHFAEARTYAEALLKAGLNDGYAHGQLARLAWLTGDDAALQRESGWLQANAASEYDLLRADMDLAAGRLREAARNPQGAVPLVELAMVGRLDEARPQAEAALQRWQKQPPPMMPMPSFGLVVGLAGEGSWIDRLRAAMAERLPPDSIAYTLWEPMAQGALELSRGAGARAVKALEPTRQYGFGEMSYTAGYLRGLACLQAGQPREAAAEFDDIIAHRGVQPGSALWALAHLELARARARAGDAAGARAGYERFLALWSEADSDLPVLTEARREYAALRSRSNSR
jgi:tetratricopeptide (TPR) repeat protein